METWLSAQIDQWTCWPLTALYFDCTTLAVHGEVLQVHRAARCYRQSVYKSVLSDQWQAMALAPGDAPHGTEYFTVRFDSNESVRRGGHVKLSRLFISEKCIGHPSSQE